MKKSVLIPLLVMFIGLAAGTAWFVSKGDAPQQKTTEKTASDATTGLSFKYPESLNIEQLTEQDKSDKFIFRMTSTTPPVLVSIRYEEGVRAVAGLSKQEPMDLLLGNTEKAFPERYPGYRKLEERELALNGKKAAELIFTYRGPNNEVAKQRLLIVLKDGNTAFYIAAQSQESIFSEMNTKYFDLIFSSLSLTGKQQ